MKKAILKSETERKNVSAEKIRDYVERLSKMINCKTVWTRNGENQAEFDRFYAAIEELFPSIASKAKRLTFGGGCFFTLIEQARGGGDHVRFFFHVQIKNGCALFLFARKFFAREKDHADGLHVIFVNVSGNVQFHCALPFFLFN